MTSYQEFLSRYQAPRKVLRAVIDPTLEEEAAALRSRVQHLRAEAATLGENRPEIAEAEARLVEVERAREESVIEFMVTAIPHDRLEQLILESPPSKADREAGRQWNPEAFGPKLLGATVVDPAWTAEEWRDFWKTTHEGLVNMLFREAWDVQHKQGVSIPLSGNGSARIPTFAQRSASA